MTHFLQNISHINNSLQTQFLIYKLPLFGWQKSC